MKKLIRIVLGLFLAFGTTGCSEEEIPIGDPAGGYFQTVMEAPIYIDVPAEGDAYEQPMIGTEGEPFIPVEMITYSQKQQNAPNYLWEKFVREGLVLVGEDYRKSKGCDEVPNSLDFIYEFKWIKVSTYKEPAGVSGVFRLEVEPNPYNKPRRLCVYLRNYDHGEVFIFQEANPDGVEPEEQWDEQTAWYLGLND